MKSEVVPRRRLDHDMLREHTALRHAQQAEIDTDALR